MKSVLILGVRYKIRHENDLNERLGISGYCDLEKRIIGIDSSLKGTKAWRQTLLHEIIHAIFEESGLNQTQVSRDAQEVVCEMVSRVFLDIFMDK